MAIASQRMPNYLKVCLLVCGMLMIISVKLLSTLDQCKLDSLTTISPVAIDTEEVCAEKSKLVSQQYQEEIENLRDQIRELQANLRREKAGNILGHTGASTKLSPGCMSELHYSEKLQHTDILKAQNYPSERHAPTFTHFDHWYHYSLSAGLSGKVIEKVNGAQRTYIDEVVDEAVSYLNSSAWRRDHFIEGIYHSSLKAGTHFELHFTNDKDLKTRVTLFRPQAPPIAVKQLPLNTDEKVNIILPLAGRESTFKIFLSYFEPLLVKSGNSIFLTIVYFGETLAGMMTHFQPFILRHKYRSYHIEHVKDRNFSRGFALDTGIRWWNKRSDPLVFLCDVDVIFNDKFLDRCKANAERKQRVYYPVVFSLYNPEIIEHYNNQKFPSVSSKLKIAPDYGMWREFGYGMACLYRSDYIASGGFDVNLKEWGEEDVLLYRYFAQSNMTVIRAPDPDLFHMWHHKTCPQSLSDDHYKDCIRSKVLNEGSQTELGFMLLKDEIERRRNQRKGL